MRLTLVILTACVLGSVSQAQQVISAHAGVVHYVEGRVLVGDQPVVRKFGQFPDLREGEELRTEDGRAEVLLTPGAFLRVAENSSMRMLSRQLSDTRFEVLTGSVMVECDELLKDNSLTLVYQGKNIRLEKHGLYRLDTVPARFQVYDGVAVIQSGSDQLTLKKGREASLDGVLVAGKFNARVGDGFVAWNGQRSGYLASANISAAQSLRYSQTPWTASGWMWDPWYNAFAFVPRGGVLFNPFGWGFWSPGLVVYAPPPVYRGFSPGTGGGGRQSGNTPIAVGNGGANTGAPSAGSRPRGFDTGGQAGSSWGAGIQSGGSSGGFGTGEMRGGGMAGGGMAGGGGARSAGGGRAR